MSSVTYRTTDIDQVGYVLMDNLLRPWRDKVVLTLVDKSTDKKLSAYLEKSLIPDPFPEKPYPLPEDYVITKITKEDQSTLFIVGNLKKVNYPSKGKRLKSQPKENTIGVLPLKIGDYIQLKSKIGTYKVVYVNRDVIVVTCRTWAKQYIVDERAIPTETVLWDDFKSLEGEHSNES